MLRVWRYFLNAQRTPLATACLALRRLFIREVPSLMLSEYELLCTDFVTPEDWDF